VHEDTFGIEVESSSGPSEDKTHVTDGLRHAYEAPAAEEEEETTAAVAASSHVVAAAVSGPTEQAAAAPEKTIEELMAEMNAL
jgi:hypothetical protein